ncbi:low-density lipoprotein receptor-related protein 4-like isoform X2 [Mercenaria mercenaria]|uniref:low-density lipoprotein receptor-related protein 4-like isoform X2 n=1 Tax=Mercenaria mercenaria TaxID=6596 RepID=UPI00234F9FF9|nr:low-density lipoprotein receptor-related protein 4-like isoform X2 [Mercenaria mercenaria]
MDVHVIVIKCLLLASFPVVKGYQGHEENIFTSPGLVWIEDLDGVMVFKHIYLTSELWRKRELPEPVNIARTLSDTNRFTHIDVDIGNKTMVLVDSLSQKIKALSFDRYGLSVGWDLYEGISKKVNGIAVDWVTDVVYWTDAAYDVILAVSMYSPNMAVVIIEGKDVVEPYGVVTHPRKGFLFWTDADVNNPRLMRSSLGGRQVKTLVKFSRSGRRAMSLFIDYNEERLYWIYEETTKLQGVSSCDIHGKYMKILQIAVNSNYFDIGLFDSQLLYIENGAVNIYQKDKSNRGPKSKSRGVPLTMVVIDKGRQYERTNPCLQSNCPGVCTMSMFREDCFCSELLVSRIDPEVIKQFCEPVRSFTGFLFPKGDGIYTLKTNFIEHGPMSTLSKAEPQKILHTKFPVKAVTSDIKSMNIFFYEYRSNMIKSLSTVEDSVPEIVSLAIGEVGGLAFDSRQKHLYWTDTLYGHIMVAREDGMFPHILHRNLEQPRAIAIYPQRRVPVLIWSEIGSGTLMKSYLDGYSKSEIFMDMRYKIYDIAIDFSNNTLYLCDESSIYETDLDGSFFKTHYSKKSRHYFTGLTIAHDYLVVTDTSLRNSGLHVFDRKVIDNDSLITEVGKRLYPYFPYGNWYGVHYHHISNQPVGYDICRIKQASCEQMCLPGFRDFRCVCGVGYKANGTSCIIDQPYKPFILLTDMRLSQLLQIHAVSRQFVAVPVQGIHQPFSIAYDPVKKMVYWSDLETGTISRSFVNGTNQEVIKSDPHAYFIGLFIEPGSRLLLYVMRHKPEYDRYQLPIGSLAAMNIDTKKTMILLERVLDDPHAVTVNVKHGYIFMTEQKNIWRLNMNRTKFDCVACFVQSTAITSSDDYVYFTNEVLGEAFFEPTKTQIVRFGIDDENITMMFELHGGSVSDLMVDKYFIYWINGSTRAVQRSSFENPGVIEDVGLSKTLFQPSGLYVSPAEDHYDSICSNSGCGGLCLPTPSAAICEEKVFTENVEVHNESGLCRIPDIKHGEVLGTTVGRVVPRGYTATVECFPAHLVTGSATITCLGGVWTDIPTCNLEYSICGTSKRGYKIYNESGSFFAYPEATKIIVICIGGGGGGYDATNDAIVHAGKAGDGGDSSFGSYLNAFGGKGGTLTKGGDGGYGHVSGGPGSVGPNCTTGGTACQTQPNSNPSKPGYSDELFCGAGGFSHECTGDLATVNEYAGPGGRDGNRTFAGYFGGGAGSREGGSGGGGGWSRLLVPIPAKELVTVTVGQSGFPSYGNPAPGLVVVMWGDYRIDDYAKSYDVIKECILGNEDELLLD